MDNTGHPRSRSRSQPRWSDNRPPHPILSSSLPDDHSVYHNEDGKGTYIDTERRTIGSSSGSSSEDEVDDKFEAREKKNEAAYEQRTTYVERKGGAPYEHDVEAQPPALESSTSISIKDPNLVTWDSDDDPYNPKNCKSSSQATVTYY